jgi:hypothetical protein
MAHGQNVERLPVDEKTSADAEAWKVAAASRKYRIHDGKVWSGGAGMLFSLDPMPGFALLPAAVQPLVFQSVAQFVTNRVGQTAEGDVQATVSKVLVEGTMPKANTNDVFERHYLNTVAARVNVLRPLGDKPTAEAKAEHEKIIADTAIKNRDAKFDTFIAEGIAASRSKPITEKKKQPKASANTDAAIEI